MALHVKERNGLGGSSSNISEAFRMLEKFLSSGVSFRWRVSNLDGVVSLLLVFGRKHRSKRSKVLFKRKKRLYRRKLSGAKRQSETTLSHLGNEKRSNLMGNEPYSEWNIDNVFQAGHLKEPVDIWRADSSSDSVFSVDSMKRLYGNQTLLSSQEPSIDRPFSYDSLKRRTNVLSNPEPVLSIGQKHNSDACEISIDDGSKVDKTRQFSSGGEMLNRTRRELQQSDLLAAMEVCHLSKSVDDSIEACYLSSNLAVGHYNRTLTGLAAHNDMMDKHSKWISGEVPNYGSLQRKQAKMHVATKENEAHGALKYVYDTEENENREIYGDNAWKTKKVDETAGRSWQQLKTYSGLRSNILNEEQNTKNMNSIDNSVSPELTHVGFFSGISGARNHSEDSYIAGGNPNNCTLLNDIRTFDDQEAHYFNPHMKKVSNELDDGLSWSPWSYVMNPPLQEVSQKSNHQVSEFAPWKDNWKMRLRLSDDQIALGNCNGFRSGEGNRSIGRVSMRNDVDFQLNSICSQFYDDEYTDGREESSLEREGSMRDGSVRDGSVRDNVFSEESISRSYSRGSSTRSTGPKAPTDRPPSYKAKNSGTGGFIVEETITSKETSTVETSANGTGYDSRVGRGTALEVNYHEDEEKKVRHEYEIDLLDLKQFLQTEDLALKANAAGYIQHLCFNDDNIKAKIRELDIIPLLVKQLEHPDEDCHRNAAGALKNLSYGRYLDDNKAAIQECSGIPISVKLLYNTTSLEVREYITGILYNLSSAVQCREELLTESVKAVAVLIVLPLSGWERSWYLQSNSPSPIIWSLVLRNSIGLLRNTSAAGIAGRQKIRREAGLVDALVWMLRAAFLSGDPHDINNKVIENIVCTLRNISYKIDMEIDRDNHADAIKVEDKVDAPPSSESGNERSPTSGSARRPLDAVGTGCLFMKKKPQRLSRKFRKKAREEVDASPTPSETVTYVLPKRDLLPLGVELIWDPDTVDLYIKILKICNNPVTLEAAAGAIHNLIACQWNWAAYLRTYVRKQEGLGPVFELLTVQQEYVVRAVALVLRNLALEERCKLVIGKNAMSALLAILPMPSSPEGEEEPSEYTICAILGTLQVLTHSSVDNCKRFVDHGGIKRVVSLTREKDPKQEKPLRTYSQRIILAANRVLMQIWDHEQFQEQFRNELWSHSRAVEEEKSHKTETLKQPRKPKRDTFAEMEERQRDIPLHRDSRRFVMIEDIDDDEFEAQKRATLSARERMASDEKPGREEYEMKNKPPAYSDDAGEQDPLVSKDKKKKEKKKGKKGSASKEEDEEDDVGETTPLYTNPVYVNKKQKEEDTVELQDGSQADSWV